jgi:hypothetical protein
VRADSITNFPICEGGYSMPSAGITFRRARGLATDSQG